VQQLVLLRVSVRLFLGVDGEPLQCGLQARRYVRFRESGRAAVLITHRETISVTQAGLATLISPAPNQIWNCLAILLLNLRRC
jgi:hypothetical protein